MAISLSSFAQNSTVTGPKAQRSKASSTIKRSHPASKGHTNRTHKTKGAKEEAEDWITSAYASYDLEKYADAVRCFKHVANMQEVNIDDLKGEAEYWLGRCSENGQGVDASLENAFSWYEKSAQHGNDDGEYKVGEFYTMGKGVVKDIDAAMLWLKKSAEHGNANGELFFGLANLNQNPESAASWIRKAADQEHPYAQFWMGYCYEQGLGVTQNMETALSWYKKAEALGNKDAIDRLQAFGNK